MILDRISRLPLYGELIPGAADIASAFAAGAPEAAPCEVRVKRYDTRSDAARRFEAHGHTIDLMLALSGAEVVHLCPMGELTPAEPLPNGADGLKLDGGPRGSAVLLSEGDFLAIFPGEAHMVGGHPGAACHIVASHIEKWVAKVPCGEEKQ